MDYRKLKLKDIKKFIFKVEFKRFPYLNKFKQNPYTYLKARYYMYCSVLFVYFLMKSRITPNMVTIAYGLCGIIGGVLLAVPNLYCNVAGIIIFFNKGILDWSDGHLARLKYKTTLKGHILDVYGAYLNSISFNIGLGFFVINQTGYELLIYPIVTIAFLYSGMPSILGKNIIVNELMANKVKNMISKHNIEYPNKKNHFRYKKPKYPKWITFFKGFLDDRARSVDFILLVMIIDLNYNYNFSLYLFLLLYMKNLFKFLLLSFNDIKIDWPESAIININKINNGKK
tara:strand:+ start:127 stop:984 length:858 start_codon:yes stop_codon:yes gene_type:complete